VSNFGLIYDAGPLRLLSCGRRIRGPRAKPPRSKSRRLAKTIKEAQSSLDGHHPYTLVISDLRLPGGAGLSIAERAAELGVKTAIMSGYLHQLTAAAADRHEVMMKPMRPAELIAIVRSLNRALADLLGSS
jgi:DNA-binding NtrC family response regulator